jgi:hypothetical protein
MTGDRKRFGEKIGNVVETADEKDTKVSLGDLVSDPMQAHVRCLRHPLGDRVCSNADIHLVVTKQRGGGLGLAKILRSSIAMRAAAYKPAYSTSVTKERTAGMRVEWQEMGWLTQSSSSVSPRYVTQVTGDAACVCRGGRERSRLIGHAAAYPTLGKFSDRPDVRPRIQTDVEDGSWWRGWGRPARMRVRRWRVGSCHPRICRSTAGIPPPPEAPWPVGEWLRGRGQAQRGTGEPGIRRQEGCRWRGVAGGNTEGTQTSEEVSGVARVGDGESAGGAVVGDREAKKFGGDGMGFGVV